MEPLGFVALSEARGVLLQQRGSNEGMALSVIPMDGAGVRTGNTRLSRGRVHGLCFCLCGGGGSFAEIGSTRLRTGSGAAGCLVLSHFSHCIFFAHRIHGIALPCVSARFASLSA